MDSFSLQGDQRWYQSRSQLHIWFHWACIGIAFDAPQTEQFHVKSKENSVGILEQIISLLLFFREHGYVYNFKSVCTSNDLDFRAKLTGILQYISGQSGCLKMICRTGLQYKKSTVTAEMWTFYQIIHRKVFQFIQSRLVFLAAINKRYDLWK